MRAHLSALATCAISITLLSGCFREPRASDAGHAEFFAQALPKLQGRRATSQRELDVLSDIATAIGDSGRRVVVRALMREEDFVTQWEHVLADQLRVDRGTTATTLGGCYADTATGAAVDAALATFVRDQPPTSSYTSEFSMTDLLRSSLRLDDVSPVYRAHLFPLVARRIAGANIIEKNRRDDAAARFLSTFMHRDLLCLDCHNSYFSTSGAQTGWDRTFPIPAYFEAALFGQHQGAPLEDVSPLFRGPSGEGAIDGSTHPWGGNTCGTFASPSAVVNDNYVFDPAEGPRPASFGSIQNGASGALKHSIWDLEAALSRGIKELRRDGLRRHAPPSCDRCSACENPSTQVPFDYETKRTAAAQLLRQYCYRCHDQSGPGPTFLASLGSMGPIPGDWDVGMLRVQASSTSKAYVVPHDIAASELYQRVLNGSMPRPSGFPEPQRTQVLDTLRSWIEAIPESAGCGNCGDVECNTLPLEVSPDAAFAYLTAANVVNKTFEELYGYPLVIANHFPRNGEEMGRLWGLTEHTFAKRGQGWSLRRLLERLIVSPMFNRTAPVLADGEEPYEIAPVLEPWSVADPREHAQRTPEQLYNATSDGVHAHTAQTRLRMLARALGWPEPRRFPNAAFPDRALQSDIGRYVDDARPGFSGVDFNGLLAWETSVGACRKPTGVSSDFIDALVERVQAGPPGMFEPAYTYRDVAIALKDRLISAGTLPANEEDALRVMWGVADLNAAADPGSLDAKARAYCGVLLESPQFLLAGLPPELGDAAPRLSGSTYQAECERHAPAFRAQRFFLSCGEDSVKVTYFDPSVKDLIGTICPENVCGQLSPNFRYACEKGLESCLPELPMCDPSCTGAACCGEDTGTLPADTSDMLTSAIEGALVKDVSGVMISRLDDPKQRPLEPGTELAFGDVLHIGSGDTLFIYDGDRMLHTPDGGARPPMMRKGDELVPTKNDWQILVMGPSATKFLPKDVSFEGATSSELLKLRRRVGPHANGTAGMPLSPKMLHVGDTKEPSGGKDEPGGKDGSGGKQQSMEPPDEPIIDRIEIEGPTTTSFEPKDGTPILTREPTWDTLSE